MFCNCGHIAPLHTEKGCRLCACCKSRALLSNNDSILGLLPSLPSDLVNKPFTATEYTSAPLAMDPEVEGSKPSTESKVQVRWAVRTLMALCVKFLEQQDTPSLLDPQWREFWQAIRAIEEAENIDTQISGKRSL